METLQQVTNHRSHDPLPADERELARDFRGKLQAWVKEAAPTEQRSEAMQRILGYVGRYGCLGQQPPDERLSRLFLEDAVGHLERYGCLPRLRDPAIPITPVIDLTRLGLIDPPPLPPYAPVVDLSNNPLSKEARAVLQEKVQVGMYKGMTVHF
jgi:hypothetical protein